MSTPVPRHYDLVVVGAGSGGYVAGIRAAQLGMTVAIVEERYWGGVCLNTGCVPSKALLRNAEIASILTHQADEFGICGDIKLDYARAVSRSREVADARVRGVHFLMRKNKITEIDGRGRFSGSHTLDVQLRDGGTTSLRFDNAIIATGSRVRMLPGVTLSDNIVTYEQQILDATTPESVIIIGAGGIGMEFAYILNSYGVDVQILEYADRALPNEDVDVSKELTRQYRRRGIPIQTNTRVDSVIDHGDHITVTHTDRNGHTTSVDAARAFICIGFCPNVENLGLDMLGVHLTAGGAIDIDDYMRTSAPPHLRDRRRHRQSATRPCRLSPRSHRRRNHRRHSDYALGLPHDATRDLLPTPSRQLRLHRRPGPRQRPQYSSRHVSHAGQRQSARPGGTGRLHQTYRRRRARRATRSPPRRRRSQRATPRTDRCPTLGPDRRRAGPQRAHPSHSRRGTTGMLPRPHRTRDQPMTRTASRALTTRQPRNAEPRPARHSIAD